MNIYCFGFDYKKVPIHLRERASFTSSQKIKVTNDLLDLGIEEVVVLSTCNRTELYLVTKLEKVSKVKSLLVEYFETFFAIDFEQIFQLKKNHVAIKHLYEVTCGLDSLVLGEDQILGQVKDAHFLAMELGSSRKLLNKLFREAVTLAKRLKTEFSISQRPLSLSYIGVEFIEKKIGSFKGKNVLIIGLGEMGKLVLDNILEKPVEQLYMSNRSHGKVIDLSKKSDTILPIAYDKRYEILSKVDVLITATGCPHTIFEKRQLKKRHHQLLILDLALPRDVDPLLKNEEKISLYNIDDLKKIAKANEKERQKIAEKMKKAILPAVEEFIHWKKTIKADEVIRSLHEKLKKIEKDTLEVIQNKSDLNKRDEKIVEKMLNSALKRVIREPILQLKTCTSEETLENYVHVLKEVFKMR